jgi:hypothetical protein
MGSRPNNYKSPLLKAFKLGTTVSFGAGAYFICSGVVCGYASKYSDFVYTVIESASSTATPTTPITPTVSTAQPNASDASLIWYYFNQFSWSYTIATT